MPSDTGKVWNISVYTGIVVWFLSLFGCLGYGLIAQHRGSFMIGLGMCVPTSAFIYFLVQYAGACK